MVQEKFTEVLESEADTCDSDDSQQDPSFDLLEDTRSRFSNISIKKKPKSRVHEKVDEDVSDDDANGIETSVPDLNAKDQKYYEIVQKIIEVGQVEKLKVEQCKLYLRKHGLRLTGKKDILIHRIKEHRSVMNGEGEHKYPASSFVMNCKGDACTGDIVMFEQNVYEMFSIASRSATGPPCGTRVIVGRIVKESYGAAKQQHTFTIEVLWSKGVKPLPPLHPLLIKGRNLYRLKTIRQKWEDESERRRILSEKHARGNAARSDREARIQEKELKKTLRENRASKNNVRDENQENKRKTSPNRPMIGSRNVPNLPALSNPVARVPFEGVLGSRPLNMVQNQHGASYKENINSNFLTSPVVFNKNMGFYPQIERHNFQQGNNNGQLPQFHPQGQRQQLCRYYAQGRCHFGTNCKYLH